MNARYLFRYARYVLSSALVRRLRQGAQLIQIASQEVQIMNARYLLRYARYALSVLACVGFGRTFN